MSISQETSENNLNMVVIPRIVSEGVGVFVRSVRSVLLKWSVQRPILSMSIVITVALTLLPVITAVALMPLATALTYSGILASQGFLFITYNIVIQGLLLAMIIVALFIAAFFIATSASVLHSYRIFKSSCNVNTQ